MEGEYARELLADPAGGIGYLLKDRVSRVGEFAAALRRVAASGTALDPRGRRPDPRWPRRENRSTG